MVDVAASFSGTIPEFYDSIMGPAQFEPFGRELAARLPARPAGDVLEIACGTGRVTRHLRERLDPEVNLVATDISAAMLEHARGRLAAPGVEWREADACRLPFPDARFGAVVCAFGIMFVPDKGLAFREMRRVLRQGGSAWFNVWDGLDNNPHGRAAAEVVEARFPDDPTMRFGSLPYLFNDRAQIRALLEAAGLQPLTMEPVRIACSCPSARDFATGQMRGTPRGLLLREKGASLEDIVDQVAARLAAIGGAAPFNYTAQALVVEARAA